MTKDGRQLGVGWTLRITWDPSGLPQATVLSGVLREKPTEQPFHPRSVQGGSDNRASQRREFQYRQRIAPMVGLGKPAEKDFIEVDCCDISAGGIAFYLDRAPEFTRVVVALGRPPALTYFAAEVVRHVEKVNDGRRVYLVGCRFVGRVHL